MKDLLTGFEMTQQQALDLIALGKDLKAGDCVRSRSWSEEKDGNDMGIIMSTTFHDTDRGKRLKKFYGDEPAYEIYDINYFISYFIVFNLRLYLI